MASSLQNSITEEYVGIIKSFKSIPKEFKDKDIKSIARKAAKPIREHAERLAPEYKKGTEHYRYKYTGRSQFGKAAKGEGVKVATYKKGNLKKSIKILSFRKATRSVFIGPRYGKRGASGVFGANRTKVDGYYAHMVFGSARAFANRVTEMALRVQNRKSVAIFEEEINKRILKIKSKTGL